MGKRLTIPFALLFAAAAEAANIQSIPTPNLFLKGRPLSSYDNMARYGNGAPLNYLNGWAPATLGAQFSGPYVDKLSAFGVEYFDNMAAYSASSPLNGLDKGGGLWPILSLSGSAYVDRQAAFPKFAFDNMGSYTASAILAGLNSGSDNGAGVSWNGVYVEGGSGGGGIVLTFSPAGSTNASFPVSVSFNTSPLGYMPSDCSGIVYYTLDGSTPTTASAALGWGATCPGFVSFSANPTTLKAFALTPSFHTAITTQTYSH